MKRMLLVSLCFVFIDAVAHGGRTNNEGCHNDKKNGGYHCHNSDKKPAHQSYTKPLANIVSPYSTLYNRKDWPHWIDEDGDCQNTRAEILIAQSKIAVIYRNSKHCSVIHGRWYDPYSGKFWDKASQLDIDHVVPLAWAHGHGASHWSKSQKRKFANDRKNLLAVKNSLNRSKGSKSPDEWMPPNHQYRCKYITLFNDIVVKYELIYVPSEKRIIHRIIKRCSHN